MAKRLGEQMLSHLSPNSIIVRTSWLYGWPREQKNFVTTMLHLSETRSELSVINDQRWAPTSTIDLVDAITKLVNNYSQYQWKILHLCNQTPRWWITRFDFAKEIFTYLHTDITLAWVPSSEYPTKAQRPQYSRLINDSDIPLPDRKASLHQYLEMI
jgi:dTDP-4-dehydrorhamnose reductase